MTEELLARLKELATQFTESELAGLRQRWQFGQELLPLRVGKKLPNTELARIEGEVGLSRRDIQHHLKFAVRYPTESDCETAVTQYSSWTRLVHLGLYNRRPKTQGPQDDKEAVIRRQVARALAGLRPLKREDLSEAAKKLLTKELERLLTQAAPLKEVA